MCFQRATRVSARGRDGAGNSQDAQPEKAHTMNKVLNTKLNMAQACLAMVQAPEHAATQAASSKAWKNAVQELENLVAAILEESRTLSAAQGVLATGKIQARERLGACAYAMASALHALAVERGLHDLAAATAPGRTRLTKGSATAVIHRCTDIYQWATENLALLEEHGVTEADLAELQACLDAFIRLQAWPRKMRAAGRAASRQLEGLFKELTVLFEDRLDRLAVKFQQTSPAFHEAFRAARKRVSPAGKPRPVQGPNPEVKQEVERLAPPAMAPRGATPPATDLPPANSGGFLRPLCADELVTTGKHRVAPRRHNSTVDLWCFLGATCSRFGRSLRRAFTQHHAAGAGWVRRTAAPACPEP